MTTRYYFTHAPADYDYKTCTTQLREKVLDAHGSPYRLVAISDDQGGTFHEGQIPRYHSGLHGCVEVGSEEATRLGLPTLDALGIDPNAKEPHEAWQAATEREASRLANANQVEEAWALRGFADGMAGRPRNEGAQEAGEYRLYYVKGYHAASCDY